MHAGNQNILRPWLWEFLSISENNLTNLEAKNEGSYSNEESNRKSSEEYEQSVIILFLFC
jgi:hypothetical protein